jgi:hypothetical protein
MRYKDENSPDRPVIEVTPEMARVGAGRLWEADWEFRGDANAVVTEIYRLMECERLGLLPRA